MNKNEINDDFVSDLDLYLSDKIHAGLKRFKELFPNITNKLINIEYLQSQGVENPSDIEISKMSVEDFNNSIELWNSKLDLMIYAFSPLVGYEEIEPNTYSVNSLLNKDCFTSEELANLVTHTKGQVLTKVLSKPAEGYTEQDIKDYYQRMKTWEDEDKQKRLEGRMAFANYLPYLWH